MDIEMKKLWIKQLKRDFKSGWLVLATHESNGDYDTGAISNDNEMYNLCNDIDLNYAPLCTMRSSEIPYLWSDFIVNLEESITYVFINKLNSKERAYIVVTRREYLRNSHEKSALNSQIDEMRQLVKKGGYGVFRTYIDYKDVYKKDTDYQSYYPDVPWDEDDVNYMLDELEEDGCIFSGKPNWVYYAWIGCVGNWRDQHYYVFDYDDYSGRVEVCIAPMKDVVYDSNFDKLVDVRQYPRDGKLWVRI